MNSSSSSCLQPNHGKQKNGFADSKVLKLIKSTSANKIQICYAGGRDSKEVYLKIRYGQIQIESRASIMIETVLVRFDLILGIWHSLDFLYQFARTHLSKVSIPDYKIHDIL